MQRIETKGLYKYGAFLYAFFIPLHQQLVTFALVLWVFFSIVNFNKGKIVKSRLLLILPVAYLLYFIGFYSSETPSFRFLEYKLSFLIFPLLFFFHRYTEIQRTRIWKFFVFGLLAASMICFSMALYNSLNFQDGTFYFRANVEDGRGFIESILYGGNYFFGRYLSVFHQTVYFALYLCVGITALLFNPQLFKSKVRYGLVTVFVGILFLISNKASFIALGLIFFIYLIKAKLRFIQKAISFLLIFSLMALMVYANPRAKESVNNVLRGKLAVDKEARYGFATRILSWDAAIELIRENPISGYGLGDTQRKLNQKYNQKAYTHPLKENYNAHNLWLQTWLENGIIGFLMLIGIFYLVFKNILLNPINRFFLITLIIILLVNSLFESLNSRFSGVSFFSFLVCYIFSVSRGGEANL